MSIKREYVVVNKLGYFLLSTHLDCDRRYIALYTKEEAQKEIKMFYPQNKIKKLKIGW